MGFKTFKIGKAKSDDSVSETVENAEIVENVGDVERKDTLIEKGAVKAGKKQKIKPALDMSKAVRYSPEFNVGLSDEQVEERMQNGYINATGKKKGKTYGGIIVGNVFTFFNILTFIVAIALIIAGATPAQLFFLLIIAANIFIGIIQEIRSKITIEKLSLITAPTAMTIRNGEKKPVPVNELVLDDVVHLEIGNQICSDSVVLVGECEVNESIITGESVPVRKRAGDILYSGSYLSSGGCYARVDKVGVDNYIETLTSNAKKYKKPQSELRGSIMLIIKIVTVFIIPVSILMVMNGLRRSGGDITFEDVQRTIMSTSGAIIGMIPAGMFLLTSMALAIGVIRLARKKALVQDLYCIEMLARVDVLCLDKTGTLTDGTMRVNNLIPLTDENYSVNDIIGSLISATGDNNQTAVALGQEYGTVGKFVPIDAMPFSSQRKLSAATFEKVGTFVLGAPEFVIKSRSPELDALINQNAAAGYRVVMIAHSEKPIVEGVLPSGLKPLFLIVIEDHIREDAIETIKWFKENDVKIKIISGDNPLTVSEVARRVGVEDAEKYISLDGFSSQEVIEAANQYTVFGRVTPEQKCLLIRAQKAKGHTVAMMGDGVNDILAMREADCSVAIASGSEAARNVSHLVLLDSNFSSMPSVVMEGRRVVNNITKSSSLFLMKTFMSVMLSIMFILINKDYPFQTNHLLLLEVFVIGLPSFFLALQTNKQRIQGNFLSNVVSRAIPGGCALVLNVIALYLFRDYVANNIGALAISDELFTSMLVLTMALTGSMILCKICEPFNAYRVFLLIGAFGLMVLTMTLFGWALDIMPFDTAEAMHLACMLIITTLVLITYFVVSMVMKLLITVKVMTE